jgi:hypothetical protein
MIRVAEARTKMPRRRGPTGGAIEEQGAPEVRHDLRGIGPREAAAGLTFGVAADSLMAQPNTA